MSSNYRSGGGHYYRGRGGGGYDRGGYGNYRGRGGYKPRLLGRYWDSDDYQGRSRDRDRDRDRGRDRGRSRSRSKSRSESRSGSHSDSRSRSRSRGRDRSRSREREQSRERGNSPRRAAEEYQPKPAQANAFPGTAPQINEQFEAQYIPASASQKEPWPPTDIPSPYMKQQQQPQQPQQQLTHSQNGQVVGGVGPPVPAQYAVEQYQQMQYQMANYQKQQQLQQAQAEALKIVAANAPPSTSIVSSGYAGYSDRPLGFQTQKQQLPEVLYQSMTQNQPGYPTPSSMPKTTDGSVAVASKKKKESKKKKRRRKSSSSSSSSSSSDSSDSRSKQKHKSKSKRDSDDSSESSSEEDKPGKEKSGGLTSQQKEALERQGDGYKKKLEILEREIKRLRAKEDELASAKADIKLIEENLKLQAELKGRCKAVNIVLEKINTVLRGGNLVDGKPRPVPPPPPKISQSAASPHRPPQQVTLVSSPPPVKKEGINKGLDFFDNGLHWCRLCNVFPETVKAMLDHFHSIDHHAQVEQLGIDEKPWHKRNSLKEVKPEPGAKKVPYRGIQFFTPVQGWYCRICSAWLGDPHCATEHLKSEEHGINFTNFLDEHPEWETKWMTDREKARARCGLGPGVGDQRQQQLKSGKYSFETDESKGVGVRYQPGAHDFEDDENAKSIRVQMRNISKENESRPLVYTSGLTAVNIPTSKDASVEEWMGKTQTQNVSLDIDTQKFAAIVRQKHGTVKEKEKEKDVSVRKPGAIPPPVPNYSRPRETGRDRDYESSRRFNDNNKRYESRLEMSFPARDRERERERDRGGRGGRRRSRSKSMERSRERDPERDTRTRRRDRTRSKSREREREREKERPDTKEKDQIRRLPIIGKMPLYKKPTAVGKEGESSSSGRGKAQDAVTMGEYGPIPAGVNKGGEESSTNLQTLGHTDESNMSGRSENSLSGYGYTMSFDDVGGHENSASAEVGSGQSSKDQRSVPIVKKTSEDMKPPGETTVATTGVGGTALPDDLQHALDIIYSGAGGKPSTIPFPPPGMVAEQHNMGMPPPPPPAQTFDFSSQGYSYMGYEPYQNSFDGYVPVTDYSDMSEGPPGVTGMSSDENNGSMQMMPMENEAEMYTAVMDVNSTSYEPEPPAPGDDDIDDLRMLGIDVDDAAVVHLK